MDNVIKHVSVYFKDLNSADLFAEYLEGFEKTLVHGDKYVETLEEQIGYMLEDPKYLIGTKDDFKSMVRIDISNDNIKIYTSVKKEDSKVTLRGVLFAGGLVLLGVFIGRKTHRLRRWKGNYKIRQPFGMHEDDVSAINWFVEQQNEAWRKNHLVLAVDRKYGKGKVSGYHKNHVSYHK